MKINRKIKESFQSLYTFLPLIKSRPKGRDDCEPYIPQTPIFLF